MTGLGRAKAGGEIVEKEWALKVGEELVELASDVDMSGEVAAIDRGDTGGEGDEESRRRMLLC